MNIAVLTHFFAPEPCAAAHRASALVSALTRSGHNVTVVTNFPSFPSGRLKSGDRFKFYCRESVNGATVIRLFTFHPGRIPGARLWHWAMSAFCSALYLLTANTRFDVIVASAPPITIAASAFAGKIRHRARLVADIRDVFPDIAVAMGQWRAGGFTARATEMVAREFYRRADLISAVTPTAIRQISSRGIDQSRLVLAPNGFDDVETYTPERSGGEGSFVAIYAGNLGLATDVDLLLDTAALLKDEGGMLLHIIGDGAERERVEQRIRNERLHNVRMAGALPRSRALGLIAGADVALVPLRAGIRESVPTKIYDALAVGCPVIVAAVGEALRILEASQGGLAVPPGDAHALAAALRWMATLDSQVLRSFGERGQSFVLKSCLRKEIMARLSQRIGTL